MIFVLFIQSVSQSVSLTHPPTNTLTYTLIDTHTHIRSNTLYTHKLTLSDSKKKIAASQFIRVEIGTQIS